MGEVPTNQEVDPQWEAAIESSVREYLSHAPDVVLDSTSMIADVEAGVPFSSLPQAKQEAFEGILFKLVGFHPDSSEVDEEYKVRSPEPVEGKAPSWSGEATVTVFRTDRSDAEHIFLSRMVYPDKTKEWYITPLDYVIE